MNKHNSVPNIRFEGFEDEWEDTVIGKLVKVYDGVHQTPTYKNNGVPFVSVENISNLYTNKFISKSDFENNFKNSKPTSGDLLMTRIGDIGTVNLVKNDNDLAYYVSLALLKPKIKDNKKYINSYFLMYLIESPRTKKELWKRTLHIAFPKKINKNEISKVNLCICLNWKEQQKIGDFFSKLDKLLDLQQQKIDKLELLKKALLQKLFPRHDTRIPEFRFKGFEEDWKKTRIGKIVQYSNSTYSVKDLKQKKEKKFYSVYDATGRQYYSNSFDMDKKYIAIIKDGSNVGAVKLLPARTSVLSTMGYLGAHNSDIAFDYYVFKKLNFKKYKVGSGIPHIYFSDYKKQVELVPQLSEQQKIGNLLSKVDQLIELENKKLQNFQQIKKSLLQNMFVD